MTQTKCQKVKKAHHNLDIAIEQCYCSKPFENDEERLEYLFKMYEEMTIQDKIDEYKKVYIENFKSFKKLS